MTGPDVKSQAEPRTGDCAAVSAPLGGVSVNGAAVVWQGLPVKLLRLVHRGLDDLAAGAHHGGWLHYLDRLRQRAAGSEPGPDPFVPQRVPTTAELRR